MPPHRAAGEHQDGFRDEAGTVGRGCDARMIDLEQRVIQRVGNADIESRERSGTERRGAEEREVASREQHTGG